MVCFAEMQTVQLSALTFFFTVDSRSHAVWGHFQLPTGAIGVLAITHLSFTTWGALHKRALDG
jgi:hypothetical protein